MPFIPKDCGKAGAKILTFDHVLNQSPIGMALLSLNGVYEAVNRAYCSILDHTPEELLDMRFSLVIPTDQFQRLRTFSPDSAQAGASLDCEQPILRRDGSLSHIDFKLVSVWGIDGLHRHLVFASDITQLKQTQEKLRQVVTKSQALLKSHSRALLHEPFRRNISRARISVGSSRSVKLHSPGARRGVGLKRVTS